MKLQYFFLKAVVSFQIQLGSVLAFCSAAKMFFGGVSAHVMIERYINFTFFALFIELNTFGRKHKQKGGVAEAANFLFCG